MGGSLYPPPIRSGFLSARAVVPRPRRGGRGVAPANPSRMPSERKGRDDRVYRPDLGPFRGSSPRLHGAGQVLLVDVPDAFLGDVVAPGLRVVQDELVPVQRAQPGPKAVLALDAQPARQIV
jgi:hypothetical protein